MATIGAILRMIFPNGTVWPPDAAPGAKPRGARNTGIKKIPIYAPDAFAAVAVLLDWSGAYQHIWPLPGSEDGDPLGVLSPEARLEHGIMGAAYAFFVPFEPKPALRRKLALKAAGFLKRRNPNQKCFASAAEIEAAGDKLQALWDVIVHSSSKPILPSANDRKGPMPAWWSAAMRLLVIADEASAGIGFHHHQRDTSDDKSKELLQTAMQIIAYERLIDSAKGTVLTPTFCTERVSSDVVSVLPKTRTAQVGCTMRALTHNLAAIFSRGQVTAGWHVSRARPRPTCEPDRPRGPPLNLLLVPFPYRIPSRCFIEGESSFMTEQPWLTNNDPSEARRRRSTADDLSAFVESLCSVCDAGNVPIHGIVFPEYALDWFTFDVLSKAVAHDYSSVEFVISGTRDDTEGRQGNFVAMRGRVPWADKERWKDRTTPAWDYECVRGKHHPWILNNAQMQRYGVTHRFEKRRGDGEVRVGEQIHIGERVIDFVEPRSGTCMTTLICEDLARIDPCQQVIRAVGPNLVIALLMDGPQILTRWPRHYASVLADDPGSSVLTFSSLGLIERASPTDRSRSRAIALWKDSRTETELHLTTGSHALAVSLEAIRIEEMTLDRRGDGKRSYLWQLAQVQTVRAQQGAKEWILQGAGEF